MNEPQTDEVQCPYCWGAGTVLTADGKEPCPICEGYTTVPPEIAQRILEVAARKLPGGKAA